MPLTYKIMKVNVTTTAGQTVIALDGMLDSASTPQFLEVINQILQPVPGPEFVEGEPTEGQTPLNLVLDLTALSYTSSQGIRGILTLMKAVIARQGRLVFRGIQPPVREVFDMCGISQAMVIE